MYVKKDTTVRKDHRVQQKFFVPQDSNALLEARSILNVSQFITLFPDNQHVQHVRAVPLVSMQIQTQMAKENQSKKRVLMECTVPASAVSQIHQGGKTSAQLDFMVQVKAQQVLAIAKLVLKAHTVMFLAKMRIIYRNAGEAATVQKAVTLKQPQLVHQEMLATMALLTSVPLINFQSEQAHLNVLPATRDMSASVAIKSKTVQLESTARALVLSIVPPERTIVTQLLVLSKTASLVLLVLSAQKKGLQTLAKQLHVLQDLTVLEEILIFRRKAVL